MSEYAKGERVWLEGWDWPLGSGRKVTTRLGRCSASTFVAALDEGGVFGRGVDAPPERAREVP